MKWRNQLLALFCLILFAAFGVFYFQHWVVQKPFGIVLFIGEGLTPSRLAATRVFASGADTPLSVDSMPHAALVTNYSTDFAAPDSAAAASTIATGLKVNNRSVGAQLRGAGAPTLVELARRAGRATGLVTDGKITGPVAAAFYARSSDPTAQLEFARSLADNLSLDVILGGGVDDFSPAEKGGARKDARDLLSEIRRKGFDLVRTKAELEAIPAWRRPKVFGGFAKTEFAYSGLIEARREQPSLPDMVRRAIELLQYNRGGYLLVVDARLMRKAAEQNDAEHTLAETLELDRAVTVARRYAGEKSTIIVCGDVGVGGLHLSGMPFRTDRGIAVLGLNSAGDPWFSWATGPHAAKLYGAAKLIPQPSPANESIITEPPQEPAAFYAPSALETVEDVIVLGAGQGSEAFHGTLDNTAIFTVIRDSL